MVWNSLTRRAFVRRAFVGAAAGSVAGSTVFAPSIVRAAQKVTLGVVNTISDAPYFIADGRGYFKAEGLDVEIINFPSGAKMISSLSTGDLDVSGGAISAGLYNANERQISIKIVADKARNAKGMSFQSLLIRADLLDSGAFKSLADLKGRKIAIPAIGSCGEQSTLNEACKLGGVPFESVERVWLATADQLAALSNKAIDGTLVAEPFLTLAERRGVARRFMALGDIYPDQQAAATTYGAEFVKKREAAVGFMKAFLRGARDYNDAIKDARFGGPKADEVLGLIAKYSNVKDVELLRTVVPSACNPDGMPNREGLERDLKFAQSLGLVQPQVKIEQVLDLSYLEAALAAIGSYVGRNRR